MQTFIVLSFCCVGVLAVYYRKILKQYLNKVFHQIVTKKEHHSFDENLEQQGSVSKKTTDSTVHTTPTVSVGDKLIQLIVFIGIGIFLLPPLFRRFKGMNGIEILFSLILSVVLGWSYVGEGLQNCIKRKLKKYWNNKER